MPKYKDVEPILETLEEFAKSTCDSSYEDGIRIAMQVINEKPIADVQEVKHGKWREGRFGNGITVPFSKYYICGQCNHTTQKKSRYCPNCGAKMGGKEKRNETRRIKSSS